MNRKLHVNEQLLIDVLYANNRQAFSFLHDTFCPVLHGSLIDLVETDKECAGHILEDGFSAVWQALQSYDEHQQKLFAWLLHMMHQLAIVALRQLNRWPRAEELERLSIGLRQKLLTMNRERCVIELMYEKGYTKARIANALNIPVETVDNLLQVGLQQLKTYLKNVHLNSMAHFSEHHKIKKSLFQSIDKILDQHGLYAVEKEKIGYTLNYWIDNDNVYKVIKGPDETDKDKDGEEFEYESDFIFNHMPYEMDCEEDVGYAEEITLDTGDILVFVTEIDKVVWFVCITMLMDEQAMNSDCAIGFTEYGPLQSMLADGLIEKVTLP